MVHLEGDIGYEITLKSTIEALKGGDRDVTPNELRRLTY